MDIKIRRCKNSDRELYNLLEKEYISTYYKKWDKKDFNKDWKRNCNKLFIILKNRKKIGTFVLENHKGYLYLSRFNILSKYRNMGIGSYLLKIFDKKSDKIRLHVWPQNPALKLYERFGYKTIKKENNGKLLMEKIR